MLDVINICLKRIPMESRKHDYKNRTLAAARLRKELEMLSDKVKKLMNFGPHLSELSGVSQSCIRNILNEKAMSTRINTAMHLVGALNMDAETITCEDLLKLIKEVNV